MGTYLRDRFRELAPARDGKMEPVFINCEGTRTYKDEVTGSRWNTGQVTLALDLVADFVKITQTNPTKIAIIAPDEANVVMIGQFLKRPEYSVLAGMGAPATVEAFQSREADIAVAVMGTTRSGKTAGPWSTSDKNRLNVLCSRQRCGLLLVGDTFVTGRMEDRGEKRKRGSKGHTSFFVNGQKRKKIWMKAGMLRNISIADFGRTKRLLR